MWLYCAWTAVPSIPVISAAFLACVLTSTYLHACKSTCKPCAQCNGVFAPSDCNVERMSLLLVAPCALTPETCKVVSSILYRSHCVLVRHVLHLFHSQALMHRAAHEQAKLNCSAACNRLRFLACAVILNLKAAQPCIVREHAHHS